MTLKFGITPAQCITVLLITILNVLGACCSYELDTNQTARNLQRRQCVWNAAKNAFDCNGMLPTVAQMLYRMQDPSNGGGVPPDRVLFLYTNLLPGVQRPTVSQLVEMFGWCEKWMKDNKRDYYFVRTLYKNNMDWYQGTMNDIRGQGPNLHKYIEKWGSLAVTEEIFSQCWLNALSLSPLNDYAILFMAHDSEPLELSAWVQSEEWVLTRVGGKIKKIYRVDPRPANKGGDCAPPRLVWERGVNPSKPPRWRCPVDVDDGSIPNLPDPWAVPPPPIAPAPTSSAPANPPANPPGKGLAVAQISPATTSFVTSTTTA